jgi:centromere protein I
MLPALEKFLIAYIRNENGKASRTVLELLSYIPMRQLELQQEGWLAALETKVIDGTEGSKALLLDFYGSLLTHWTNSTLSSPLRNSVDGVALGCTVQLIQHASVLLLSMLETSHGASEDAVLSFLTRMGHVLSHTPSVPSFRIVLPPVHLIYLLAFRSNLSTISRLCSILAMFKRAFEDSIAVSKGLNTKIAPYPTQDVDKLNGCVMDVCNLIWRNRAFNRQDINSLGCCVPEQLHQAMHAYLDSLEENLSSTAVFSLSYHNGLSALSAACVGDIEDRENPGGGLRNRLKGPANHKSLLLLEKEGGLALSWQNYRLEMLQWLEERGSEGVGRLIRNTMKILRQNGT